MAPSDDGRLDPLLVQDDRGDGGTSPAPPRTPSPRSRAGSTDTRARTPASAKPSPTPSPASIETIRDGASNSITTISSLSRARIPPRDHPQLSDSRPLHEEQGLLRARKRRHREQDNGEPFTPRETRSYKVAHVHGLWHLDFHQGSRGPYSLRRDNGKHLSCSAFSTIARASVAISSGISLRPPRPSCMACRRPFRNAHCRVLFSPTTVRPWSPRKPSRASSASASSITLPYSPEQNGKQESFWGQIEGRLLPMLEGEPALTLDLLNTATQAWVEQEYQRKVHSEIRESPSTGICVAPASAANRPARTRSGRALRTEVSAQTAPKRRHCHRRWRSLRGPRRVPHPPATAPPRRPMGSHQRRPRGPRSGDHLVTLLPIDKARNAERIRRVVAPADIAEADRPRRHRAALACPRVDTPPPVCPRLLAKTRPRRRSHRGLMTKLLSLYGLKFHPLPAQRAARRSSPPPPSTASSAASSSECADGRFAMITGDPGTGKSIALRVLSERLRALPDVLVGTVEHPQSRTMDFYPRARRLVRRAPRVP